MKERISKALTAIKIFIKTRKKTSLAIFLILLASGYFIWQQSKYVLASAEKATIISSVSGSGQVSASHQINLTLGSGASGKITYLNAKAGQDVKAGTLLLAIDSTDAQKSIRDAENSLQSAQIALQKLANSDDVAVPSQDALNSDYDSAYNSVSTAVINMGNALNDAQNALYGTDYAGGQKNWDYLVHKAYIYDQNIFSFKESAEKSYSKAQPEYETLLSAYKNTTRSDGHEKLNILLAQAYSTAKDVSQAVRDANNFVQFYKDILIKNDAVPNSQAATQLSTLGSDASKVNSDVSALFSAQNTIQSDKLNLASQQLAVEKAQNALTDAKISSADYSIYAPFDGQIGSVAVQKGESITASTTAMTFITPQEMTTISFSETDIPKIKLGNKAIMTFDAIDGLSITGKVTEIDSVGTVSNGVVSYNVKITFDTQDERVKPGMSVTANIITETKQDVLSVPNSAVKSKAGNYYVLVPDKKYDLSSADASLGFSLPSAPTQKEVQIGIADDQNTQITGGLSEGDQVVEKTISSTASSSAASKTTTSQNRSGNGAFMGTPAH